MLIQDPRRAPRLAALASALLVLASLGVGCATPAGSPGLAWQDDGRPAPKPEGRRFRAKDGFYVGGSLRYGEVEKDFDGQTFVSGGGSAEVLPALDAGSGAGLALGMRGGGYSVEFNYSKLGHDGDWLGVPFDVESEFYGLDFRKHFREGARVQPHLLFGVGFGCVTVEDGSVGGGQVEDAVFNGLGLNLGGGLIYNITERLGLVLDVGYRFLSIGSVDGVVSGSIDDDLYGSGPFAGLQLYFTF